MTCGTGYTMRWKGRGSSNAMKARQKDNLAKGIWSHLSTKFSIFSLAFWVEFSVHLQIAPAMDAQASAAS